MCKAMCNYTNVPAFASLSKNYNNHLKRSKISVTIPLTILIYLNQKVKGTHNIRYIMYSYIHSAFCTLCKQNIAP